MKGIEIPIHELSPRVAGLLHPEYWEGHTIGHGELTPFNERPPTKREMTALGRSAAAMHFVGALGAGQTVLQTFRPGDAFDTNDLAPGTVLGFDDEKIITSPFLKPKPIDLNAFEGIAPAERTRQAQNRPHFETTPQLGYIRKVNIGIVTRWDGKTNGVIRQRWDVMPLPLVDYPLLMPEFSVVQGRVNVGQTGHHISSKGERELMQRDERVEVYRFGEPKDKGDHILSWLLDHLPVLRPHRA